MQGEGKRQKNAIFQEREARKLRSAAQSMCWVEIDLAPALLQKNGPLFHFLGKLISPESLRCLHVVYRVNKMQRLHRFSWGNQVSALAKVIGFIRDKGRWEQHINHLLRVENTKAQQQASTKALKRKCCWKTTEPKTAVLYNVALARKRIQALVSRIQKAWR